MFHNCTKLKLLKILLIVCLSLVFLQYVINLVAYKYVSRFFGDGFGLSSWANMSMFAISSQVLKTDHSHSEVNESSMHKVEKFVTKSMKNINTTKLTTTPAKSRNNTLPLCPLVPPKLVGSLATYKEAPSFEELKKLYPDVKAGGRFKPKECIARHRVAIIIPYRDRESQLRILLHNLHPFLQRQQLDYGIYAVELALPTKFNRAILMNAGFVEALKIYNYQCFIFHDVDLIPENDKNLYTCPEFPRHMSAAVDKFSYRLPYQGIFGGVSALTKEQMEKVNGFSNKYFGWGGEDDDMYQRITGNGLKVIRYPLTVARYKMIRHGREKTNAANPNRFKLLNSGKKRMQKDGLNTLRYDVLKIEYRPLYTWISVSVDEAKIMNS